MLKEVELEGTYMALELGSCARQWDLVAGRMSRMEEALELPPSSTKSSAVESKERGLSCALLCFAVLPCAVLLQCNHV